MSRKIIYICIIFLLLISSAVCAQEGGITKERKSIRERIRERINQRIEKRRDEKRRAVLGPRDQTFSLSHDGLKRKYIIHLPPLYNKSRLYPVVIYIHGGGGDERAAFHDQMDKAADKHGFILAIPVANDPDKGTMTSRWNGGKWATGACCGDTDDVGFLSNMIDEILINFSADAHRIYAAGISNGGLMTNRIAGELSHRIAAIATVAPAAIPLKSTSYQPIPVMTIHGTADPCNPYDGSAPTGLCRKSPYKRMSHRDVDRAWLEINQCSDRSKPSYTRGDATCIVYEECAKNVELQSCKVEDMGHTWPGGDQYLSHRLIGPVSHDITNDQIWAFFKRHSKDNNDPGTVNDELDPGSKN